MGRHVNVAPWRTGVGVSENIFEQAHPMRNEMGNPAVLLPTVGMTTNRELFQFPHFSSFPPFFCFFFVSASSLFFFLTSSSHFSFMGAAYGDHGGTTHSYRRRLPHSLSHTLLKSARQPLGERNQVRARGGGKIEATAAAKRVCAVVALVHPVRLCVACSFPAVFPLVRCALFSLPIAPLAEQFVSLRALCVFCAMCC